jgi:AhpD family alkylhydroperoxidase
MQARMKNPLMFVPEVMPALMALAKSMRHGGVPTTTLNLVSPRDSQINGSSVCVDGFAREARNASETEGRLSPRQHGGTPRASAMRSLPPSL